MSSKGLNMANEPHSAKIAITPALITFAFVRERIEQTGDMVSGLVPLFAPIIKERSGQIFDANLFAKDLNKFYGILVSPLIVKDMEPRLAKAKLLEVSDVGSG